MLLMRNEIYVVEPHLRKNPEEIQFKNRREEIGDMFPGLREQLHDVKQIIDVFEGKSYLF